MINEIEVYNCVYGRLYDKYVFFANYLVNTHTRYVQNRFHIQTVQTL